ncbi:hypothetical protein GS399_09375 [Pedobacter sp. HMF7647]|uniref:Uncharacterized protein n=1 Tax=Hufsiella arboris TaxID=2695275 RepID=A0A7K1YAU1_9SPHI|nr:hypothetical protein [Hufsiella arboris]MXV51178.1 hypothetical protein [Hufsiella arboris]
MAKRIKLTANVAVSEITTHLQYRSNAFKLLAANPNFFGTNPESNLQPEFVIQNNKYFEELGCIGYHPTTSELTANIQIKQSSGYGGNLCSRGSHEFVRFFLDYGDGIWLDMGVTAVNVHDIEDAYDCEKALEKPLSYVVRLKIDPKHLICSKPNLPKIRAVLSWNITPPPGNINPPTIWGDTKEAFIQISPLRILFPTFPLDEIGPLLASAILNPSISLSDIAATTFKGIEKLDLAKQAIAQPKAELSELTAAYANAQVEPERIATKILNETIISKNPAILSVNKDILIKAGIDLTAALKNFASLNGNTSYEQLYCVGADYHQEALVANIQVKKPYGYSGSLCKAGSKEYVGFWIQSPQTDCRWQFVGTSFVNSYDIELPEGGLSYSVILPADFSKFRTACSSPTILKVRAVLSWNVPPSDSNPNEVPYWGNIIDSYIQVSPGKQWDGKNPVMITLGGVSVDNIDDISGLTLAGAVLEFNQAPVYNASPFAGIIVLQGLSHPLAGLKYRVKIRNLADGSQYYYNAGLHLLGFDPVTSTIIHPVIYPDADNYYVYQSYLNNIDSILARFSPGTNDLLEITIEHEDGASVSKRIQMDNQLPQISLTVDRPGCGGYAKGEHITGSFSVYDAYLLNYSLGSSWPAAVVPNNYSGTTNVASSFDFDTSGTDNPCGSIGLSATEKTIHDSAWAGYTVYASEVVCLK